MFTFALILILLVGCAVLFWVAHRVKKAQGTAAAARAAAAEAKPKRSRDLEEYGDPLDRLQSYGGKPIDYNIYRYAGLGTALVAVVLAFFSTFTTIPTKDIGVKTAFGAPTGYLTNGAHFKAPWENITLMDGAIQTDTHNNGNQNSGCVQVRIAHQIVACANMYVKWQVNEPAVDGLFRNYREFSSIKDALVDKNLQAVLNHVFESYDPLAVDADGNASAPQLSVLSREALTQMQSAVGDQITVKELNVTVLGYNDATQKKIDALQAQVAQTRIAQQSIKTAEEQSKANETLAQSLAKSPNVLVSSCLDSLNEAITKGYPLPAGFSCWPGGSSAVIVPGMNTPSAKK